MAGIVVVSNLNALLIFVLQMCKCTHCKTYAVVSSCRPTPEISEHFKEMRNVVVLQCLKSTMVLFTGKGSC